MAKDREKRDPLLVALGLAIQKRRQALGISQEEAAARTGLNRTYYADVERGTRNIGFKNIVAIARGLEIRAGELIREIE